MIIKILFINFKNKSIVNFVYFPAFISTEKKNMIADFHLWYFKLLLSYWFMDHPHLLLHKIF